MSESDKIPMKKTVLITGTSSGIGKAAVKLFAAKGWNVVATMRNPAAETELNQFKDVLVTRLDVQDQASIGSAIEAGIERFGKIDVLINNAGFGLFGLFEAASREKIAEQFEVNVFGVMDVTRTILPHFRANKSGLIINVSSVAGVVTLPIISLYHASKFALEGFSESLAYELASQNIRIKLIEPGGVHSNFHDRSAQEFVADASLTDYDAFVSHVNAVFDELRSNRLATSEDVAQNIYSAATDGTDQLRYVVGTDILPLIAARRESTEQEYINYMRSRFLLKS